MSKDRILLPDFIVIGAMKSGTTTLHRHLLDHPGIDMSRDKETDFFVAEKNWPKGLRWYSGQFSHPGRKRGEVSPNYAKCRDFPGVPGRIVALCPQVRLIYIVRDPVARAISQFRHGFIQGRFGPEVLQGDCHEYAHIMDASHYARQLDAYLTHFPQEAIVIVDFDDLITAPAKVMDRVATHIGVAPHPAGAKRAQNDSAELSRIPAGVLRLAQTPMGRAVGTRISRQSRDRIRAALALGRARKMPDLPDALLSRMRADLAGDVARFRRMTGMPFSHWSL
ncbi:MAG: sulfotransferase [Thalassovita sp.]|nr:sulfotransferase [Thalassovita sp.]